MQEPQCLVFGPFRLDLRDERLWRGDEATSLSPKTFAVLRCLVTQADQLVTKDALLEAVWPDTAVSRSSRSPWAEEVVACFTGSPPERPSEDPHAHDMVGSRAECLDKVQRWQAAGIGALYLVPRGPDPLGQMRLFMDEVTSKA